MEDAFFLCATVLSKWNKFPGLPDEPESRILFEFKIGGRLTARHRSEHDSMVTTLLGTITALDEPHMFRLSGPLTLDDRCVQSVVTVRVKSEGNNKSNIQIVHQTIGNTDDQFLVVWDSAWKKFLDDVKRKSKDSISKSSLKKGSTTETLEEGPEPGTLANKAMLLMDQFEREFNDGQEKTWEPVARRFMSLVSNREQDGDSQPESFLEVRSGPGEELEAAYQDLQSHLIEVRQAVAHAIAAEKQLEQQVKRNEDQESTWKNRADMADQQKDPELAEQARMRMKEYTATKEEIQFQLNEQRNSTSALRQQLTNLEAQVQRAYTQKQILITRDKAARATLMAKKALEQFDSTKVSTAIERLEHSVATIEAGVSAIDSVVQLRDDNLLQAPADLLNNAILAMQSATDALTQLRDSMQQKEVVEETIENSET